MNTKQKELLAKYGAPISKGFVIYSKTEISEKIKNVENKNLFLKLKFTQVAEVKQAGLKS